MYFLFHQLKGPRNNDTPIARRTLSAQILASNPILQWKEMGFLEEVADSRTGAGNTWEEPEAACSGRKLGSSQQTSQWWGYIKGTQESIKELPNAKVVQFEQHLKLDSSRLKTQVEKYITLSPYRYQNILNKYIRRTNCSCRKLTNTFCRYSSLTEVECYPLLFKCSLLILTSFQIVWHGIKGKKITVTKTSSVR